METDIFEKYHSRHRPAITTASISLSAHDNEDNPTWNILGLIVYLIIAVTIAHMSYTTHTKKIKLHDKILVLFEEEIIPTQKKIEKKDYYRPPNKPVQKTKKEQEKTKFEKILPKKEKDKNIFLSKIMTSRKFTLKEETITLKKSEVKRNFQKTRNIQKRLEITDKIKNRLTLKKAKTDLLTNKGKKYTTRKLTTNFKKSAMLTVNKKHNFIHQNINHKKPKFNASLSENTGLTRATPISTKEKAFKTEIGLNSEITRKQSLTLSHKISINIKAKKPSGLTHTYYSKKHSQEPMKTRINTDIRLSQKEFQKTDEIRNKVIFHSIIEGDNLRIDNLRRTILDKISNSNLSEDKNYCIKAGKFLCQIEITGSAKDKISIFFSPDEKIPFKILSKLERKMPQGLKPCN